MAEGVITYSFLQSQDVYHYQTLDKWKYQERLLKYFGWTNSNAPTRIKFDKELSKAFKDDLKYPWDLKESGQLIISSKSLNICFVAALKNLDANLANDRPLSSVSSLLNRTFQEEHHLHGRSFQPPRGLTAYFKLWLGIYANFSRSGDPRDDCWRAQKSASEGKQGVAAWIFQMLGEKDTFFRRALDFHPYSISRKEWLANDVAHWVKLKEDSLQKLQGQVVTARGPRETFIALPRASDIPWLAVSPELDVHRETLYALLGHRDSVRRACQQLMREEICARGMENFRIAAHTEDSRYCPLLPDYEQELQPEWMQHLHHFEYHISRNTCSPGLHPSGVCFPPKFWGQFSPLAVATALPNDDESTLASPTQVKSDYGPVYYPFYDWFLRPPTSKELPPGLTRRPTAVVQLVEGEILQFYDGKFHDFGLRYTDLNGLASSVVRVANARIAEEHKLHKWERREFQVGRLEGDGSISYKGSNQWLFSGWPEKGIPNVESFLHFFQSFYKKHDPQDPIVVLCLMGLGRTGTFIAIYFLVLLLESAHFGLNLPGLIRAARSRFKLDGASILPELQGRWTDLVVVIVEGLREQRRSVVETAEQFLFIYKVVEIVWQKMKRDEWYFGPRDGQSGGILKAGTNEFFQREEWWDQKL